jgi:hypothetical protein
MIGKRCSLRAKRRLPIRFGTDGLQHAGYTVDLSREGLDISATTVYRCGVFLHVQITTRDGANVCLCCEVRWAKKMPAQAGVVKSGMGLRIISITEGHEIYESWCPPQAGLEKQP